MVWLQLWVSEEVIALISHRDFEEYNVDIEVKLCTTACSVSVCLESRMVLIQGLELAERDRECIKTFSKFFTLGICAVSFFFKNILVMLQVGQNLVKQCRPVLSKKLVSFFHLDVPSKFDQLV